MKRNGKTVCRKSITPHRASRCCWTMCSANWPTAAARWWTPSTGWRWCPTGPRRPFETLLLPKAHVQRITDLTDAQRSDLALALKKLTSRYDNLFQCSFPLLHGLARRAV
ncbi:hypothetical protein [Klebsiella pneumoniae]|uniref:hypothetical protein n=1 Tax=Klebsiella pneumoniae TaxID=573 RepID=UPI003890B7B6